MANREGTQGDYDPYKHRIVHHPTTYAETMIHLLKGCIGAGILAVPYVVKGLGIIYATIGICLIVVFALYCLQVLIYGMYEIAKRQRVGYVPIAKSMELAILAGPSMWHWTSKFFYYLVEGMLLFWQFGVCAIYFVFCSENLKQVLDYYGYVLSVRVLICCCLPGQILLNLVRDLKYMTPISTISNFVTVLGFLLVSFYIVEEDVDFFMEELALKGFTEIPLFIATTLFALEAVGVVLALEHNMEKPEQYLGVFGLLSIGMIVVCVLFLLMGIPGYLKYGKEIKASITLNLPIRDKKAQAARVFLVIALYLSFPLQNYVAYEVLWMKIQDNYPNASKVVDYGLRVTCVIIPFLASVIQPNLGALISLLGALCLSMLALILPAVMDACLLYPHRYGAFKYKLLRDVGIVIVGWFCLISGIYTSLLEFK